VTRRPTKNLAASVHQRLLNKAHESGRPFAELLQYYAMERFLYRLSVSPYADRFVLKGALMLAAWKSPVTRPTMDIDLLGRQSNDVDEITAVVREVCTQESRSDGLVFDPGSIRGLRIKEDAGAWYDVWVMDLSGGNRRQITFEDVDQYGPVFCFDWSAIAYSAREDGGDVLDIWLAPASSSVGGALPVSEPGGLVLFGLLWTSARRRRRGAGG
jgi:hypothetical protein